MPCLAGEIAGGEGCRANSAALGEAGYHTNKQRFGFKLTAGIAVSDEMRQMDPDTAGTINRTNDRSTFDP